MFFIESEVKENGNWESWGGGGSFYFVYDNFFLLYRSISYFIKYLKV